MNLLHDEAGAAAILAGRLVFSFQRFQKPRHLSQERQLLQRHLTKKGAPQFDSLQQWCRAQTDLIRSDLHHL